MFGFNIFLSGLAGGLKTGGVSSTNYNKGGIHTAISSGSNKEEIKNVIAQLVQQVFGLTVKEQTGNTKQITAEHKGTGGDQKVTVTIQDSTETQPKKAEGATSAVLQTGNKVTITITLKGTHDELTSKQNEANKIANKIWKAAQKAKDHATNNIDASRDFGAFQYIAFHDILAMFCRFVYGKFAVGYNWNLIPFIF